MKEPRWVVPFLRALERTGMARTAAEDAGVDYTTAYARRRAHADFADAWEGALKAHEAAKKRREEEEGEAMVESVGHTPHPPIPAFPGTGPSLSLKGRGADDGEDLVVSNGQFKRASGERWGRKKQEALLAELVASGNMRRACRAAGISRQAVDRRRRKDPYLDAAREAAIVKCQRTANEFLASAVAATVDPDALPDPDTSPLPKISIAEAIKIVQIGAAKAQREAPLNPFAEQAARMAPSEIDAARERLLRKFKRLGERQRSEKLEQGWTLDEEQDAIIPPGWVKAPGTGAKEPDQGI